MPIGGGGGDTKPSRLPWVLFQEWKAQKESCSIRDGLFPVEGPEPMEAWGAERIEQGLEAACQALGNGHFPWEAGRRALGLRSLHEAYATSGPTLGEVLRSLARFSHLLNPSIQFFEFTDEGKIFFGQKNLENEGRAFPLTNVFTIGMQMAHFEKLGAFPAECLEVRVRHTLSKGWQAPSALAHCVWKGGCDHNALGFPLALADRKNPWHQGEVHEALFRVALQKARELEKSKSHKKLSDKVKSWLLDVQGDMPQLHQAAAAFRLSPRTFQRRLEAENEPWSQLRDHWKMQEAKQRVAHTTDHVTHIAFDPGFADVSAFIKAFRRWTGCTPTVFRKRHQGG